MKRSAWVLVAGMLSVNAWATDLVQVYRDALAYDAQFASARAALEAGREKLPQGRAGLLPNVGLSASSAWNKRDITEPALGDANFNTNGYTLQLTQPLFRWQNWVQYKQGELQVGLAEAQFGGARQDLILRAAQAYFDVLNAQDTLTSVQALKGAEAQQLELAKKSFEVGTVTITDVHEAQSRFDLATAQEIAAQSDLDVKRYALSQLIGKDAGALAGLRSGVQIQPPRPAEMAAWVSAAESANINVQAQQIGLEIASREVERNRAAHLPTVDLVAMQGRNRAGYFVPPTYVAEAASVGVQMNLPIYSGGIVNSRTREAEAQKDRASADLDNARRSAAQNARQAFLGVNSGLAQVRALEAALVSSQSALDANKLGYEVGVRINIDVLNAQSQLYDTQQKLAKSRYDTLLAQLRLKAAAGTLAEEDVQAVNALLQP
ncbi:MAG: TolC family outer membrane protein [Zoogloea sp.]|nr:TolC family outer membrane protein [Zoogloea sp.]